MMSRDVSDLVLAVAREGMPFQTHMPTARHYVENLFAAFNLALGARDEVALEELTHAVALELDYGKGRSTAAPLDVLAALGRPGKFIQTIANRSLTAERSLVHYVATYQVWTLSTPSLACTALGHINGTLVAGPQVWRWANHCIMPVKGHAHLDEHLLGDGDAPSP